MTFNIEDILACPNCTDLNVDIHYHNAYPDFVFCIKCNSIFPVIDGIYVLLHNSIRNYNLEFEYIKNLQQKYCNSENSLYNTTFENTINILQNHKETTTWEWEDEIYWTNKYNEDADKEINTNWKARLWQRELLINNLTNETSLSNKILVDIGCGEGQNFRKIIAPYCEKNVLYIPVDISMSGLQLNRKKNKHKNALFILASASYFPFKPNIIDIISYFGILHHTEEKESLLKIHLPKLKNEGYIIIHEAIHRKIFIPKYFRENLEQSAHEERIYKDLLIKQIDSQKNLKIIFIFNFYTIFLRVLHRIFHNFVSRKKHRYVTIIKFDNYLYKRLGKFLKLFNPGEIMVLLKKTELNQKSN